MEKVIDIENINYPKLLRQIKDPPKKLYYKGEWDNSLFDNCLSVVGSRRITPYGKKVIEYFISGLQFLNITIVSGFMYGCDAYSHKAALEYGLKTIAVMPCGIDVIHPYYQKDLYGEILDSGGLVVSELPGTESPKKWYYPKRNRIVAGLSRALLIIEAGIKSGSLITGNYSADYNRKVFAVPGSIFSKQSTGNLQIINEYAEAIYSYRRIINFYDLLSENKMSKTPLKSGSNSKKRYDNMGEACKKIILLLDSENMTVDEIAAELDLAPVETNTIITHMCINGLIMEQQGRYYVC